MKIYAQDMGHGKLLLEDWCNFYEIVEIISMLFSQYIVSNFANYCLFIVELSRFSH